MSGSYDEGISSTRDCANYSLIDCLTGPGGDPSHNFGSLNYGHTADRNGPGSFVRCGWINKDYRNPKLGYRGDNSDTGLGTETTPSPNAIDYDVTNNVTVGCNYGMTAERGARVRNTNEYTYNQSNATEAITGASIGDYPVPSWAQVTALTPTEAKDYVKTFGGCLPHDAFDTALVAEIP